MRTSLTPLLAAIFVGAALAGCIGSGGPLAADFVATSDDNQSFMFDAGASSGSPDTYTWDFGDGNTGEGKVVEHRYEYVNGDYDVTLTVASGDGEEKVTKAVTTGNAPNQMPMLMVLVDKRLVKPGQEVLFDARATHDMDGDPVTLSWDFNTEIEADDLESWVNIGMQQYAAGDDPHAGHGGGEESGEPRSVGPPTPQELDDAWDRYQKMLEERPSLTDTKPRHGGAAGSPYEAEYVEGFDGKVNDSSPMQFFSWPEAGTYFVLVDAVDIKGGHTKGFVAIKVDPDAPEDNATQAMDGTISYAGPDPLFGGEDPGVAEAPRNWWLGQFEFPYPGTFHVSAEIDQELGAEVSLYVCRASSDITWQDCAGSNRNKATAGPAVDQLAATVKLDEKDQAYQFAVYAVADSDTPSGAEINLNVTAQKSFDLNPWYDTESGMGGGGGHH